MSAREVVICHPVRTALGTHGGSLKDVPAPTLGATVIRESLRRSGLPADKVQTLVMGNVIQAGVKMNPARQAGIAGGLPVEVPALAVNRGCGSGAQAIVGAALEVWSGMLDCSLAGGMENMDRAPHLLPEGRWGARMGDVTMFDSMLMDGLNDAFSDKHSGWHTEDLVIRNAISREEQDRLALRSQKRFGDAQAAGRFDAEIVAVEVAGKKGPTLCEGRAQPSGYDGGIACETQAWPACANLDLRKTSSMWKAVRSHTAIRSARPVLCSRRASCTPCSARAAARRGHLVHRRRPRYRACSGAALKTAGNRPSGTT